MTPANNDLISINDIMALVYEVVGLPFVDYPKQFNENNFKAINLSGVDIVAYRQRSLVVDEMFVMELSGDPVIVKSIVDSFSSKSALDTPFISGIDVSFRDDACPQILRTHGHFVMSKDGWSKYHLHDLNGTPFWQHAINFKDKHGVPDKDNNKWSMTWCVYWVREIKK